MEDPAANSGANIPLQKIEDILNAELQGEGRTGEFHVVMSVGLAGLAFQLLMVLHENDLEAAVTNLRSIVDRIEGGYTPAGTA